MSFINRLLVTSLILLFCTPTFAQTKAVSKEKTFTIGVYKIPVMITSADSGTFIELFKEAAKRAEIKHKIEMYPSKRAKRYFRTGEIDGFFPAIKESAGFNAAKTEPIYMKANIIFTRKDSELISNINQLTGKTVGLTRGYNYDPSIVQNPKIKIKYNESDVINVHKLSTGEIDAFVVEEKTGLAALKESRVNNIHYNSSSVTSINAVFFAFQNDEDGKAAASKISEALIEMKKDGTFDNIMERVHSKGQ